MRVSDREFEKIQRLVLDRSAIVLDSEKKYLVESRLTPIVRRMGFDGFGGLVRTLQAEGSEVLVREVVDAMTTNETSFFRDLKPFDVFREHILPELMERRKLSRRLRIWSAACSSGQEVYSIAMTIRERFPELTGWTVEITGTDVSSTVLERARKGTYSQLEINRGLPARLLVKYFAKEGVNWRIRTDLRSMVRYEHFNLSRPWGDVPDTDVIFLRNVLIYFNVATRRMVLENAFRCLRPDGFLFLGNAETTLNIHAGFERVPFDRAGCYRLKQESKDAVLAG